MKKALLNKREHVVDEALEGIMLSTDNVLKLEGYNVIMRSDYEDVKQRKVTIISGGGSGHEPSFCGFVGEGFLTAAVAGGVFASPSASAVLAAIRAVCGPQGCLVVIMNYTGDRLNFGMACERAKAEGFLVEMLITADDCALPDKGVTGRRGVAGTLLVQKVACAAAEAGLPLGQVLEEATQAGESVATMGVALQPCTLPGEAPNDRLDASTIEIGLGIHGEPGVSQSPLLTADELTLLMLHSIETSGYLPLEKGQGVVLMVNNLGATPLLELLLVVRRAVLRLEERGLVVWRVYSGAFMTSLDMVGVSCSVMRVSQLQLSRLDAKTEVTPWTQGCRQPHARPRTVLWAQPPAKKATGRSSGDTDGGDVDSAGEVKVRAGTDAAGVRRVVEAVVEAIIQVEPQLTEWDSIAGDGDCGITFRRGVEGLLADLEGDKLCVSDMPALLQGLAESVGRSMGGTSGAILETFFCAAEAQVRLSDLPEGDWRRAFAAGVEAVMLYGGATPGMCTLVDALVPAGEAWDRACEEGKEGKGGGLGAFEAAVKAAEEGAEKTLSMGALAGRANYVSDAQVKTVPDPGAKAVAAVLRAVLSALSQ